MSEADGTAFPFTLVGVIGLGLLAIGLWVGVLCIPYSMIRDKLLDWDAIRDQVTKVIGSTMTATVLLLIVSLIYFLQDQTKTTYAIYVILGISACVAYSAMAASII